MLGRLWSALVGCGRRRRCSIVNRSRSGSVRGSGGCLVGSVAWSALVGCGRRRRCSIVNRSRSGSVRGSGGCLVGSGRLWSVVAWSALVGSGGWGAGAQNWRVSSTTLVRGAICGAGS